MSEQTLNRLARMLVYDRTCRPTGIPGEVWVWSNNERYLVRIVHDPDPMPEWYREVEAEFNSRSQMPLVLDPDSIENFWDQAFPSVEAMLDYAGNYEGDDPTARDVRKETAERVAVAIGVLAYGVGFAKEGPPETLAEIEADYSKRVRRRKASDLVREAYYLDQTVSNEEYGKLMEEADQMDYQRELEAEAASAMEE